MWQYILLAMMGFSFGILAASGVFTVLSAVGLVPRFCQRTNTANYILEYENMIILGTIIGCVTSIWEYPFFLADWLQFIILIIYGVFSGIFVGCLALAIAEMLDSIPIFSKRIRLKEGLSIVICSMAIGKIMGSLFYFLYEMKIATL